MEALAYLRPVQFELTDQTRLAIDEYLRLAGRKPGQFLFSGRGDISSGLTRRQYARLVHYWLASIGLDLAKCVMARFVPLVDSAATDLRDSHRRATRVCNHVTSGSPCHFAIRGF